MCGVFYFGYLICFFFVNTIKLTILFNIFNIKKQKKTISKLTSKRGKINPHHTARITNDSIFI